MWMWFAKLGSPRWFYEISTKWLPWLVSAMCILMIVGIVWALLFLPPDYQQSFTTRILVIHVAVAGTSLAFFPLMAVSGTITLVWKMKLADMVAKHAAPLGAWFSLRDYIQSLLVNRTVSLIAYSKMSAERLSLLLQESGFEKVTFIDNFE